MTGTGSSAVTRANAAALDLRSDTVTRPDAAMRAAMAAAELGDDVYGEDPTVARLEAELAHRLGKPAGVFFPTGTQSNLAALMAHCGRGDEALVGAPYHITTSEAAGASVLAGIALCPLAVEANASLAPETLRAAVKPDDVHAPISRLLCLENTVGGQAIPLERMKAPAEAARALGLAVHLDGARIFNALAVLGCEATALAAVADTVSVCLSKGLGAPAGTVLVGEAAAMARARRHRKILGGGMRQAGVLAAAGLHALEHQVPQLAHDHRRAATLAEALGGMGLGAVRHATNMVFLTPPAGSHGALAAHMARHGVTIARQTPAIRLVLHRDIDDDGLDRIISAFAAFGATSAAE